MVNSPDTLLNSLKQTDFGPIPTGWEVVKLGDVGDFINGYAFKPSQWSSRGRPIIRIQNLTGSSEKINTFDGELHHRYLVTDGDLLVSWSASLGAFIWRGGQAWVNQHIFKVDNLSDDVDKAYLFFVLGYHIDRIRRKTRGTTMKHVTRKEFVATPIPLPPLPEQRRIAHVLSTIERAIEAQDKVIAAANELKRSLMDRLFTYGPGPEPVPTKDTEIGEMPEHWQVVRMIDAVALSRKPKGLSCSDFETLPFIPMDLIPEDGVPIRGYVSKRPSEISSGTYCETGDVLLAKITPSFENGKQAIVAGIPIDFAYATTEVYPLKARCDILDRMFLFHLLKWPRVRTDIAGKMEGSTGRQRVPKAVIEEYLIPLPPLPEQREMADALSAVERRARAAAECKAALQELLRSMLHQLMTGQVRVQDIEV